jgi:hypothetical protein
MIILYESNLRGTHVTNPRQYPSSASKCSEQLVECMLIQPMASNMIMTLIGVPV